MSTTKEPCPACGSTDNLIRYEDGHAHCFTPGCTHHEKGDAVPPHVPGVSRPLAFEPVRGRAAFLETRKISEETCAKWNYQVAEYKGKHCQVANYYRDGQLVAQKLRFADKGFAVLGDGKDMPLYGQWLWRDGGKMVVITEGEIDALSVSQAQGNKWPVVSIPNGAQSAKKSLQRALEWLEKFDSVILMFDMDEPGQLAAKDCATLFAPGKAKIASLPLKDANEMLKAGRVAEIIDGIWGAKEFRPDGIVSGRETWALAISTDEELSLPYPWAFLNEKTRGLRQGELVTLTAGSGIGKSAVCREIAYALAVTHAESLGYIALEENVRRSVLGLMSIDLNRPLHLNRAGITEAQMRQAWEKTAGSGRFFFYDHFGSTESENLLARIRYLAKGCGCKWIVLDHLSIVVSGQETADERKAIDVTMTKLRQLVEETRIGMLLVSHLKRPQGDRGHEEGLATSLSQLRGSHSIAQLSDMVIGLERNQQAGNAVGDDEDAANRPDPNVTTIRVLKNRYSGETGIAGTVRYNAETGRLTAGDDPFAGGSPAF